MTKNLAVACLDDDSFYLTMVKDMLNGEVASLKMFNHSEELAQLSESEVNAFHVIILDFDLGGKTIVDIGLPEFLRQKKNFRGSMILFSLLEEFGPDQPYIDQWFSCVLNKDKIDQQSLLSAISSAGAGSPS